MYSQYPISTDNVLKIIKQIIQIKKYIYKIIKCVVGS